MPGVRLTLNKIERVLELVTLLPDGSQNEVFEEFKTSPEKFPDPLLVHMRRRNGDGSFSNYVMFYIKRKQDNLVEQTF